MYVMQVRKPPPFHVHSLLLPLALNSYLDKVRGQRLAGAVALTACLHIAPDAVRDGRKLQEEADHAETDDRRGAAARCALEHRVVAVACAIPQVWIFGTHTAQVARVARVALSLHVRPARPRCR
jgi:hypothetical protein